ncbi:MAG: flavodoxin [Bacteroidales bacterium]|nr:flavodoxin [Bacteroidales bacterium]MBN2819456.1 flavodoxin [Bacteroidales bacterium]
MKKIGLFYSFKTNKTALIAKKIAENFDKKEIDSIDAEEVTEDMFTAYDNLILGCPTWFDGELPNYWDEFVPAIEDLDLKGKKIAIYGNGDQKGYPENFCDAVGLMAGILEKQGAEIVGFTSADGYTFESSSALRNDKFCGLALDFENQAKQNNKRVEDWCTQLKKEFN